MPDEQHAKTNPSISPEAVSGRSFPPARRGYDPDAVRRFLEEVAGAIRAHREREGDLSDRLADAERRAASPVLDEETLTAAVGAETAKVLRTAHEAARDVVARAEARAAELVVEAGGVLAEKTREAESEARASAARARAEAASLLESTTAECRSMVDEAREARRRILADLAERRRGLHLQLEQLRAGKDALVEVVDATARSVEDVRARLVAAEAYARVAADRVGESPSASGDGSVEGLIAEARSLPPAGPDEVAEAGSTPSEEVPEGAGETDAPADGTGPPSVTAGAPGDGVPTEETRAERVPAEEPGAGGPWGATADAVEGRGETGAPEQPVPPVGPEAPEEGEGRRARGGAPSNAVDDLFARLRAATSADAGEEHAAVRVPGEARGEARPLGGGEVPATRREPPEDAPRGDAPRSPVEGSPAERAEGPGGTGPLGPGDEDAEALARREEAVGTLQAELARIVKRELRSAQNELLDALRNLPRGASAEGLLPGADATARLAASATPPLLLAFRAGGNGTVGGGHAAGVDGEEAGDEAASSARDLAEVVVSTIRARLEGELSRAEDVAASTEVVGAAYREWRGERVDDLVSDQVARVYSAGVLAALGDGARVRWVVDDGPSDCPDCDDNALAGAVAAGEPFPTGQSRPPVHAGCRCMLVPSEG
ncbi:MAG: DivIVA domain-containing protein [Actinomycetota bacterium]|nr:DivIVA domain-containing protein [Actinomycetota bacterium]